MKALRVLVKRAIVGFGAACGGLFAGYLAAAIVLGPLLGPGPSTADLAIAIAIGTAVAAAGMTLAIPSPQLQLRRA